jgi:sulfoxide reductase heme-binding subunit YedZ
MARSSVWFGPPWRDGAGRLSPLKSVVFGLAFVPAAWLAIEFTSGRWDWPTPYVLLIYHSGLWSTYMLLLSLAVTPARRIFEWGRLVQIRRMVGVAALFYTLLHLVAWFGLRFWDGQVLTTELLARPSLWAATAALIGLLVLGSTSFDAVIRTLGATVWKRLHYSVYGLAGLAILHFLLSPGSLQGLPFLMAGVYFWLMTWRVLNRWGQGANPGALSLLGLAATTFTFVLEPVWLATVQAQFAYQSPLDAMRANFDLALWGILGPPPSLVVLIGTQSLALYRVVCRMRRTSLA